MNAAGSSVSPFWQFYQLHYRIDVLETLAKFRIGDYLFFLHKYVRCVLTNLLNIFIFRKPRNTVRRNSEYELF